MVPLRSTVKLKRRTFRGFDLLVQVIYVCMKGERVSLLLWSEGWWWIVPRGKEVARYCAREERKAPSVFRRSSGSGRTTPGLGPVGTPPVADVTEECNRLIVPVSSTRWVSDFMIWDNGRSSGKSVGRRERTSGPPKTGCGVGFRSRRP